MAKQTDFLTKNACKKAAIRNAQKTGTSQIVVRDSDFHYVAIPRYCSINAAHTIVTALGGKIVDEVIVLK